MSVGEAVVPSFDLPVPIEVAQHQACPVTGILRRVGDRWSVLVVVLLGRRNHRFNELHRSIEGVSQRMLTLTLRNLERDGLVSRTVHPTVPPSVEYALTDLGRTLLVPLSALAEWAADHGDDVTTAQARYDLASTPDQPRERRRPRKFEPCCDPLRGR
ncbi:winged helix-turn-helix transcriptional regulator [Goodfellowiella coeruleoviolacea]|uniref:winged helix-turn-helix transcriptional regulator n=1 Tax=Goodfellowiella coeruleoviolacea TaxID=334858 RepID=UPI003899188C